MKKEFKKGDIVVITKPHSGAYGHIGNICVILDMDNTSVPYKVKDFKNLYSWNGDHYTWCENVRKPTYEELASIGIYNKETYEIY